MKEFDEESLTQFNGKEGKPAYVVYQGRVIDVSQSKLWPNGLHMTRHRAGKVLTSDIQAAPHGIEVLERFPQVGILKKEPIAERPMPRFLAGLLSRYPILRRHPHPMVVHFPIVFMFATTLFNLLYLVTRYRAFEITALHCLGGGIIFIPLSILTGYFTWWLNYLARPMRPVTIKKRFSFLLLALAIIAFIWRILVPEVLTPLAGIGFLYFIMVLSFIPIVTTVGWFGARLTFPLGKE